MEFDNVGLGEITNSNLLYIANLNLSWSYRGSSGIEMFSETASAVLLNNNGYTSINAFDAITSVTFYLNQQYNTLNVRSNCFYKNPYSLSITATLYKLLSE